MTHFLAAVVADPGGFMILRSDRDDGGAPGGELSVNGGKLLGVASAVLEHLADGVNFGSDGGVAVLNDLVDDNITTVRARTGVRLFGCVCVCVCLVKAL